MSFIEAKSTLAMNATATTLHLSLSFYLTISLSLSLALRLLSFPTEEFFNGSVARGGTAAT